MGQHCGVNNIVFIAALSHINGRRNRLSDASCHEKHVTWQLSLSAVKLNDSRRGNTIDSKITVLTGHKVNFTNVSYSINVIRFTSLCCWHSTNMLEEIRLHLLRRPYDGYVVERISEKCLLIRFPTNIFSQGENK